MPNAKQSVSRPRTWYDGMYQTLRSAVAHGLNRKSRTRSTRLFFRASDGETCEVWWRAAPPVSSNPNPGTNSDPGANHRRLVVFLPGGMALGNGFYIEQFVETGALAGLDWCAFHNPGIANRLKYNKLVGFADPKYLLEFLAWLDKQGYSVTLIGFSAGSVLALKTAGLLDDPERNPDETSPLECVIAVHGPDKISHVFDTFYYRTRSRLDIPFALWLWHVYRKSGSSRFTPLAFPWLRGWPWMKELTEASLNMSFSRAEQDYLSCVNEISRPLRTPVLRILARNDPVVPFQLIDQEHFKNLRDVWVTPGGGHCALFKVYPDMGRRIREWMDARASD